ncbi:MAG: HEAT repeat domain-containing protein [Acidobacteriota bacterium]
MRIHATPSGTAAKPGEFSTLISGLLVLAVINVPASARQDNVEILAGCDPAVLAPALERLAEEDAVVPACIVPSLVAAVKHPDPSIRLLAVEVLAAHPQAPEQVGGVLLDAARDPVAEVRAAVPKALGRASPRGSVDALGSLLRDPVLSVRAAAAEYAAKLATPDDRLVEMVASSLSDEHPWVKEMALETLASFDIHAVPALAAIRGMVRDQNWSVRVKAAAALGQIHADRTTSQLAEALQKVFLSPEELAADKRAEAEELRERPAAVSSLVSLLTDNDTDVQVAAAGALKSIGRGAEDAIPALLGLTVAPLGEVRAAALDALNSIGACGTDFRDTVVKALTDWDPTVQLRALELLAAHGVDLSRAWPSVEKMMQSRYPEVRTAAASLLGRLGPQPARFERRLRQIADHSPDIASDLLTALSRSSHPLADWEREVEQRAVPVIEAGQERDLIIGVNQIPVAVASWCHYSQQFVRVVRDIRLAGYLDNVDFVFFLCDEWTDVRKTLEEEGMSVEEASLRTSVLRRDTGDTPFFDPDWVAALPGPHYLVADGAAVESAPAVYSFDRRVFATNVREWMASHLQMPVGLLDCVWSQAGQGH